LYIHLKLGMLPPRDAGAGEPRIQTAQITFASAPVGPKLPQIREILLVQNHPTRRLLNLHLCFEQFLFSRLAGYEDVDGAERLSQDPTLRLIGSEKIWARWAAAKGNRNGQRRKGRSGV
jgi:hypothetical protein